MTESRYGDYQLNTSGFEANTVYGAVLYTNEGNAYGLRHLENIWRVNNLAWCTGFTNEAHGCATSSEHYKKIMGQTINKITYFTDEGKKSIPVDIYVPIKTGAVLTAESAAAAAGSTTYAQSGLADDFAPVYTVTKDDSPVDMTVSDGKITFDPDAVGSGAFTLTVSDAKSVYAPVSTQFELTIPAPAVFNEDIISGSPAITAAEGVTAEQLSEYLSAVRSVTVNEQTYQAFGRGAVTIIDAETGMIDTSITDIFNNEDESFAITVSAVGYEDMSFTLKRTAAPDEQSSTPDEQSSTPDEQSSIPDEQSSTPDEQSSTPNEQSIDPSNKNFPSTSDNSAAGILMTAAVMSVLTALFIGKKKKKEEK